MWGSRSGSDVKVLFTQARGAELNPMPLKRLGRVVCAVILEMGVEMGGFLGLFGQSAS